MLWLKQDGLEALDRNSLRSPIHRGAVKNPEAIQVTEKRGC